MCLIIFGLEAHPHYKLVLIANRDEFYHRPSLPAHFWEENKDILAGKDVEKGGTWLGITKKGRFAAITNYRDPQNIRKDAPSRGELTLEYLKGTNNPLRTMFQVQFKSKQYNGFNLLLGDPEDLFYYSNYS
ncbi:MAG: NRDE family protein, partial [Raineya sp.]